MNEQVISKVLSIIDQQLPLEQTQNMLRQLQAENKEPESTFIFKCIHAMSAGILPVDCVERIKECVMDSLTSDELKMLEAIVVQTTNTYFRAVGGELVWQFTHNCQIGEIALNAYTQELDDPSYDDEYHFIRISLSICRIYANGRCQNYDFQTFLTRALDHVTQNATSGYLILNLLEGLFNCGVERSQIIATLEQVVDLLEQNGEYNRAADFSEKLIEFYRKAKIKEKVNAYRIKIAELYEKAAEEFDCSDSRNVHQSLRYIQSAMNAWAKIEDRQEAKKRRQILAKKANPIKALLLQSLQSRTIGEYDLTEAINHIRSIIENGTFESMLIHLINLHKLKDADEYIERLEKSGFALSSLFSTNILDDNGRLTCIVPALHGATAEERIAIAEHEARKEHTMCADAFTSRYLHLARSTYTFSEDSIRFLVESNAFVPDDRKDTFLKGLVAGFNLDFATAMHLLMPQVENAVRNLAELCGAVVYKTYPNGVEECLSLDSILALDEVKDSLDPELIFNMRVFYTSDYGIGMRDIIGHGLRSDKALQSSDSLATWWFTLRLVCLFSFELHKRIHEQESHCDS